MAMLALLLIAIQDPDIEALLKQLEDESIEVRDQAAQKLIDLGEKAEEKVKARMESADGALKLVCKRILEQIAVPKKLRGLLPPIRKATIDATDRSLKEVMEDLRRQTGLPLDLQRVPEGTVTVSIRDAVPLEALDAVCKAASLGYRFDVQSHGMPKARVAGAGGPPGATMDDGNEAKIRFQPGQYFEAPRLFVRHYLVEPTNLTLTRSTSFRASNSSASVSFRVAWAPDVRPQTGTISLTAVTDDKGRSLLQPRVGGSARSSMGSRPAHGNVYQSFQLIYPEADATRIAKISGTATLKYLLDEKALAFEAPEESAGQKKEHGGLTVELQECKVADGRATVRLAVTGRLSQDALEGWHGFQAPIRLKLASGAYAQSLSTSFTGGGMDGQSTYRLEYLCSGKVAAIEVVAETVYHTDTFDFELKDIQLPK